MMWLCGCRVSGSVLVVFFFFKQKTAYEMRMSDWSSDVCSSDLQCSQLSGLWARANGCGDPGSYSSCKGHPPSARSTAPGSHRLKYAGLNIQAHPVGDQRRRWLARDPGISASAVAHAPRSEEHTSELQSLMRNSYAVFCLKKKKHTNTKNTK